MTKAKPLNLLSKAKSLPARHGAQLEDTLAAKGLLEEFIALVNAFENNELVLTLPKKIDLLAFWQKETGIEIPPSTFRSYQLRRKRKPNGKRG